MDNAEYATMFAMADFLSIALISNNMQIREFLCDCRDYVTAEILRGATDPEVCPFCCLSGTVDHIHIDLGSNLVLEGLHCLRTSKSGTRPKPVLMQGLLLCLYLFFLCISQPKLTSALYNGIQTAIRTD